ncbi:hypothetical protein SKAU_G00177500 [Synaphobranchus kaupii]|uniref:Uncharacterized protein n=1 Tax=Synaphobranchus kaupii TaxID=118154 RepID=A0A9Q1FLM8_SYNKA|nr:hypothetical protein SKAU_G00177500 [Synaphobranchus kaupii]
MDELLLNCSEESAWKGQRMAGWCSAPAISILSKAFPARVSARFNHQPPPGPQPSLLLSPHTPLTSHKLPEWKAFYAASGRSVILTDGLCPPPGGAAFARYVTSGSSPCHPGGRSVSRRFEGPPGP